MTSSSNQSNQGSQSTDASLARTTRNLRSATIETGTKKRRLRQQSDNSDNTSIAQSKLDELSLELWEIILQGMYPSQLTQVAQISPRLHDVIANLPVWKTIADTAGLSLKPRGKVKTYYDLVLKLSDRVCEVCFKGCKKIRIYEMPLPVSLGGQRVMLCLECRLAHFKSHPESHRSGITLADRQRYGGDVGVEAYRSRNQSRRQKRDEVSHPERAERRTYISQAFAEAGRFFDETKLSVSNFIKYGGQQSTWEEQVRQIIHAARMGETTAERRREIVRGLGEYGLQLRSDSRLCAAYIQDGVGDIDDIVTVMREMDWYFRETDYQTFRYVEDDYHDYYDYYHRYDHHGYYSPPHRTYLDSGHGKDCALDQYARNRLDRGMWNDVGSDADTPARPPESLWRTIRQRLAQLWRGYADRFIPIGVDACHASLLLCDPSDMQSFNDATIVQVLDLGAAHATRNIPENTTFSSGFRQAKGDEQFNAYLNKARTTVKKRTQDKYVAMKIDDLPSGISDFVSRCSDQEPALEANVYDRMERSFIETEIPALAEQENVHPGYLVHLLKELKKRGRISLQIAPSTTTYVPRPL
ncbi:hypothetical protein BJV82DRAFT_578222 [Fennellomyces sp. T-0311]|nr:hypothetical protein BJV82DRAFT_578222 [Fennellomyces sp. T-0311]